MRVPPSRARPVTDPINAEGPALPPGSNRAIDNERTEHTDEPLPPPPPDRPVVVLVTADREMTVAISLDASSLIADLDRVASVLAAAADQLRPASPVPSPPMTFEEMPESERELLSGEPVDRTGLCDHCDKPQTGGAAGGGLPPEHWCDEHRPDDWLGSFDDDADAPEPWEPKVGDRVTVHYTDYSTRSVADGTPATVEEVFGNIRRAVVRVDRTVLDDAPDSGWHAAFGELRPLADEPGPDVPPLPLLQTLIPAFSAWLASIGDHRTTSEVAAAAVRYRLAAYPADTTAAAIYAEWFPEGGAA